jgi:hypothetical protein
MVKVYELAQLIPVFAQKLTINGLREILNGLIAIDLSKEQFCPSKQVREDTALDQPCTKAGRPLRTADRFDHRTQIPFSFQHADPHALHLKL